MIGKNGRTTDYSRYLPLLLTHKPNQTKPNYDDYHQNVSQHLEGNKFLYSHLYL